MKRQIAITLAGALLLATPALAATTSYNSGSLGAAANGINSDGVLLNQPGALAAPGDFSTGYTNTNGVNTQVPYNPTLNPAADQPFSIEFWANPSSFDNDTAVVSNRTAGGVRAGWVFYQRDNGWNWRMYNGIDSNNGQELLGGAAPVGSWSHVVGVWDGSVARLYVNGLDTGAVAGGSGVYAANGPGINLSIGTNPVGDSPYDGLVDETAFYDTALGADRVLAHFLAAANPNPGIYQAEVQADGPLLHLTNAIPEPSTAGLIALGCAGLLRRRRN